MYIREARLRSFPFLFIKLIQQRKEPWVSRV